MEFSMDRGSSHPLQDHPKFDQINVIYIDNMYTCCYMCEFNIVTFLLKLSQKTSLHLTNLTLLDNGFSVWILSF